MLQRFLLLLLAVGSVAGTVAAQIGGQQTFRFLAVPTNAKLAAVGGVNTTSLDQDVNMLSANPALLNSEMDKHLSFSYVDYLSDIRQNNLTYVFNSEKAGRWGVGINYMNYGDFIQRDAAGNEQGTFSVNDYALNLTHAREVDNFTFGATAKLAVSSIAGNKSVATLLDLGGTFKHPEKEFLIGLVLKNVGVQVKPYDGADREPMPFDAQLGMSYKLEHMPLRFSVTAHHLHQFDIVYLDPNKKGTLDENNNEVKEEKKFFDKLSRHFVFGGEFLLSKNFQVRAGYNHLRRKELRLEEASGGAGFSFGAMARIGSFQLDYGRAWYHTAGAANYITVTTNLNTLFKSKAASN